MEEADDIPPVTPGVGSGGVGAESGDPLPHPPQRTWQRIS
jgi:hypothetical protein